MTNFKPDYMKRKDSSQGERDREGERGRGKPSSEIGKEKGLSLQPLQTLGNNNGKF